MCYGRLDDEKIEVVGSKLCSCEVVTTDIYIVKRRFNGTSYELTVIEYLITRNINTGRGFCYNFERTKDERNNDHKLQSS